jgi:hypothetical protein
MASHNPLHVSQPPPPRGSQASRLAPPARAASNAAEASVGSFSELAARQQPVPSLGEAPPESIESLASYIHRHSGRKTSSGDCSIFLQFWIKTTKKISQTPSYNCPKLQKSFSGGRPTLNTNLKRHLLGLTPPRILQPDF